jgi:hypothetical protein
MRARHRHFNPKSAGAVAAYDARFISGLSDGDNVSTWASRTGTNDATQTTVGKQPNYETNEIGGQPVVNFTPANSDELEINITVPSSATIVAVHRRSTAGIHTVNFGELEASTPRYTLWWFTDNIIYVSWNGNNLQTFSPAQTTTGSLVVTTTKNGTTSSQVYINGATFRAAIVPSASNGAFNRLGRSAGAAQPYGFNNGAIGSACLIDAFVSDGLRRRLEHAAAFSFKIACN